jgi:7-keto-8-aminopelargonate synthetase-like enzyme
MAKTLLALAAALLAAMTVFTSAAEACLSCEYVPEVLNSPSKSYNPSKSYKSKRSSKKRTYTRTKKRKARPAKNVDTAKSTPIDVETEDENSAISAASEETNETVVETAVKTETTPKDKPRTTKNVGCKKFFPSVGMTLSVTCE